MKKLLIHLIVSLLTVALCYGCYLFILGDFKSSPLDRFLFVISTLTVLIFTNIGTEEKID